jgi:transposase-like protein
VARKRKIPLDQHPVLVADYIAGSTVSSLAVRCGCSRQAIKVILREYGVTPRARSGTPSPATQPDFKERLVELYQSGVRLRDVSRRLKVSTQTASDLLQEAGVLQKRRRGENSTARRKIKPEQEPEVTRLYKEGNSLGAIAKRFGCTGAVVRNVLRPAGLLRKRGAVSPYRTDPTFGERVSSLWESGLSITKIAEMLEVGFKPVSRALQDAGYSVKPSMRGERHPMWSGGRSITEEGYVLCLLQPDHLFASMRGVTGYVLEHRLVMAQYLGRPLLPSESVHHISGDRTDNRIENLQLRIGMHGSHVSYCCADCGSHRIVPTPLKDCA